MNSIENENENRNGHTNNHQEPLDRRGRSIPNRFGIKMVFSIIEVPFSILPGIAALVFTLLQNSDYKKKDWESFRKHKLLSTICLVIGGFVSAVIVTVITIICISFYYMASDQNLILNLRDMLDTSESARTTTEEQETERTSESGDRVMETETDITQNSAEGISSISINSEELTIPAALQPLLAQLNTELTAEAEAVIAAQTDESYETADGRFSLDIYNTTDREQALSACMVGGIDFYPADTDHFLFMDSLTEDSAAEDYITVLGDGYQTYSLGDVTEYCWFTDTGWFSVDMNADGSLYCLSIYSYTGIEE